MAARSSGGRSILLTAHASEAEIRALQRLFAVCGCESIRPPARGGAFLATADCMRVLFVGDGMAARVHRGLQAASETDHFALLIAHDQAVLEFPDVLARCADALIAPYEETLLRECLEAIEGDDEPLPEIHANFIGRSPQIRQLLHTIVTVARYDAPVLITGETGTGKELAARGIHYSSARRDQPFVPVNCGALSDDLLLAELFGYEKGAFTDAKRAHRGLVAQAAGGVLFLDELDSLSVRGQAALLRFLQEQEYRPIGAESTRRGDVRVITATNKNIQALVTRGLFREDLYYRVHLLDLELPPLRAREGDIAVLAEYFLDQLSRRYEIPAKRLHPMTTRWMLEYEWPGNVRELQNYLYRLFVLSRGSVICVPRVKGAPMSWHGTLLARPSEVVGEFRREKAHALNEFERDYLQKVMKVAGGNVSLAARHAGKERRAFRRLLKKHGIDRATFRAPEE